MSPRIPGRAPGVARRAHMDRLAARLADLEEAWAEQDEIDRATREDVAALEQAVLRVASAEEG